MATSKDKYYTEMCNTINDYNDFNNTPWSNVKIQEAIGKAMEEESIMDANDVTVDTFSRAYNTQRENANAIFTSENLDKSDELLDSVKNFKINDI